MQESEPNTVLTELFLPELVVLKQGVHHEDNSNLQILHSLVDIPGIHRAIKAWCDQQAKRRRILNVFDPVRMAHKLVHLILQKTQIPQSNSVIIWARDKCSCVQEPVRTQQKIHKH